MKARRIFMEAYPESCPDVQTAIASLNPLAYAYILHDKDTYDTGELKKPHWHIYMEFENERHFSAVGKAFNLKENFVEKAKSKKYAIRYLTHIDNPEKYQYEYQDIVSSEIDLAKYYKEVSEALKVVQIFDIMDETIKDKRRFKQFVLDCTDAGCFDTLRRADSLFLKAWSEEKDFYSRKSGKKKEA